MGDKDRHHSLIQWLTNLPHVELWSFERFKVTPNNVVNNFEAYQSTLEFFSVAVFLTFLTLYLLMRCLRSWKKRRDRKVEKTLKQLKRNYKIYASIATMFGIMAISAMCVGSIRAVRQTNDALRLTMNNMHFIKDAKDNMFLSSLALVDNVNTSAQDASAINSAYPTMPANMSEGLDAVAAGLAQVQAYQNVFDGDLSADLRFNGTINGMHVALDWWFAITIVMFVGVFMALFGLMYMLTVHNRSNSTLTVTCSHIVVLVTVILISLQLALLVFAADIGSEPEAFVTTYTAYVTDDNVTEAIVDYYVYCDDGLYPSSPLNAAVNNSIDELHNVIDVAHAVYLQSVREYPDPSDDLLDLYTDLRNEMSALHILNEKIDCEEISHHYNLAFVNVIQSVRHVWTLEIFDSFAMIFFMLMMTLLPDTKPWKEKGFIDGDDANQPFMRFMDELDDEDESFTQSFHEQDKEKQVPDREEAVGHPRNRFRKTSEPQLGAQSPRFNVTPPGDSGFFWKD